MRFFWCVHHVAKNICIHSKILQSTVTQQAKVVKFIPWDTSHADFTAQYHCEYFYSVYKLILGTFAKS
jgi:hypothetical protein